MDFEASKGRYIAVFNPKSVTFSDVDQDKSGSYKYV